MRWNAVVVLMALNSFPNWIRGRFWQGVIGLWRHLPLSGSKRQKIRHRLFRNFPKVFGRAKGYREWLQLNPPVSCRPTGHATAAAADPEQRIIVVSHDAQAHGGQFLALGMVRALVQEFRLEVEVILLLGAGRLKGDFEELAPVHQLNAYDTTVSDMEELAQSLARRGFARAIVNTTATGRIVPVFKDAGIESVCLVHELPGVIRALHLERDAALIAAAAKSVVFPAQVVADGYAQFAQIDPARQVIRPQGLYRSNRWRSQTETARAELRKRLGFSSGAKLVLAVGYADHRKGVDLFVECALQILAQRSDAEFVWVGHWDADMQKTVETMLCEDERRSHLHFVGYEPDTSIYHAAADVYALTSREDPFPNVVLESFDVGVPVVAFASTGGAAGLVGQVGGIAVRPYDTSVFAAAVSRLLDEPGLAEVMGEAGKEYADRNFSFRDYLCDLCGLLDIPPRCGHLEGTH